jgi:hypothetical protein
VPLKLRIERFEIFSTVQKYFELGESYEDGAVKQLIEHLKFSDLNSSQVDGA